MPYHVMPIGTVTSGRADHGNSDHWGDVLSVVTVDPNRFGAGALTGLDGFSHAEILYIFDRLPERDDYTTPQRSRGRNDMPPVGVSCDRGPGGPTGSAPQSAASSSSQTTPSRRVVWTR
jgi:tRNA (Thr-GGU) A37 N-methylase